jgi:hypothetical protein
VLLPKEEYSTEDDAKDWLAEHGYRTNTEDSSRYGFGGKFWRSRQFDPSPNTRMRTIRLGGSGIEAVVAAKDAELGDGEDEGAASAASTARAPRAPRASLQRSAAEQFYDDHPKAIFGTTMVVSAISGIRMNERLGMTVTRLQLQPSTAAGLGFLAVSLATKQLGFARTSQVALAASLGQGLASFTSHVPRGPLISGGGGSPRF